jgi:methylthioribose-1-phosphate isomerase
MNGDFANKIGTYNLAVMCKHHGVPLYVAAPYTTIDPQCQTGADIVIEERGADEVLGQHADKRTKVYNPAFDVTPRELVSGWITDKKLFRFGDVREILL